MPGFAGTHRRPSWRKSGRDEGFRIVHVRPGHVRRLNRPVEGPGTGAAVGIDRGVAVSAALSTGELPHCPGLAAPQQRRLRRLERKLARAARGSQRRTRVRHAVARLKARGAGIRKDWCEKTSTDIAAGHAVTARGGIRAAGPANREPQPVLLPSA